MQTLPANLKVSRKLLWRFCLVAAVSLLVGIVGIVNILRLQDMDSDLYQYQALPLLKLRVINGCFEQNRVHLRDMVLENDPDKIASYIHELKKTSNKIDYSMQTFAASQLTEVEKKEFAYFSNVLENFNLYRNQVATLCAAGNKELAHKVMVNDGPRLSANFAKAIDRLSLLKEQAGRQAVEENKRRAQAAMAVMVLLLVLAGFAAARFGMAIARMLSAPLEAEKQQLSSSLAVLQRLLNGLDACLYVSDPHTNKLLFINDKMKREFCLEDDIAATTCWQVLQAGFTQRCDFCPVPQLLANPDTPVTWEEYNTATHKYYKNTDCIIEWLDGKKVHLQHSVDITNLKSTEASLTNAKLAAESASLAKSEFLSRMSHEMRTPMNAIIGMTNIARTAKDQAKKEYCLEKIDQASKHLLGVINDILDMSKIEANKFELYLHEFNLESMLMNIMNVVTFRAEEKKQNLIVNLDPTLPFFIISDETRLSQVITNLLSNAIKFTPNHGTIVLTVTKQEEADNISILKIEVSDNGIGISEEQQARLFTSFEQADGSISRKYGGTGLGLAISQKIVKLMDGSIWIESKLDEGAKFSLTIKVKNGTSQQQPVLSKQIDKTSLRILAVDDSPETRDYFLHVMSAFGLACDVAANGQEALALIHARQEAPYNIIFVDWLMPDINGIDLSKKIKQLTGPNTVVIMISVSDWSDIEKEATAAGISKFIAKPLFPSAIMNAINEIMGVAVKDQTSQFQLQQHDFTAFSLLVAEDVDVNREILASLLEDTGIAIDFAVDGAEALDRFAKQPDAYSLILMDVHMPKMNGYETVRNIRSLPIARARQVPIIAMTADVFREDIEKCLEAGMNDHIGKPIDPGELITKLNKYLPPTEAPASACAYQPITFPERLPPDTSPDYTDLLPILDVRAGLDRLMNNKKLYFTLLKNFTGQEIVAEIISLIETDEPVKAANTAHALKGAAANLGLTELSAIAAVIEIQAKNGINVTQLTSSLTTTMDATIILIQKLLEREGVR